MAAVAVSQLSQAQKDELFCTYAALILHDESMEITEANISKLVAAAGGKVEPYMPGLFAKALAKTNVGDLLAATGTASAGPAPAAGGAAADAGAAAAPAAPEPEPEDEEDEDDMGFDLFDA